MKSLLVVAILASTAEAKDTPEVAAAKAALDAQVTAINAQDGKAFAATFDDDAFALFPNTTEAASQNAIKLAAKEWFDLAGKITVKPEHVLVGELGDTKCAWLTAELVAGKTRYRVTEFIAPQQKGGSDYRVQSAHLSEPVDDKASLDLVAAGKLPGLPTLDKDTDDFTDNPVTAAKYLKLSTDAAVAVIGSAPGELATGKAAAGKLKEFGGLDQKLVGFARRGDSNSMNHASSLIAHVEITYKVKGKPVVVPYRVHVITAGKTLAAIHYSVATK
jgi:ketosteroid isomerase-like protein